MVPSPAARAIVLGALTEAPVTTSELYDRLGYPALLRAGLIDYRAFRGVLAGLAREGLAVESTAEDGSTRWQRP